MQIKHATELFDLGFSLMPVSKNRKPLRKWKHLQTKKLSLTQVTNRCIKYRNCNLGIVTGQISNLYVVDFDTEESLTELQKHGKLPKTVIVKTNRGYHYYFRPNESVLRTSRKFFPGIDFKGEGGFAMSPWSMHPSGTQYSWLVSPADQEIAVIPEWIESLILLHKERVKAKKKKSNRKPKIQNNDGIENQNFDSGSIHNHQDYQPTPMRAYQISFNKALRKLKKKIPDLVIKRGINFMTNNNKFNKLFPDRANRIQYILWDYENEKRKNAGKDFYISYGIMLEDSQNNVRQFGIQIQHFLKKYGINAVCNPDSNDRIRIINSITHLDSNNTHQNAPGSIK